MRKDWWISVYFSLSTISRIEPCLSMISWNLRWWKDFKQWNFMGGELRNKKKKGLWIQISYCEHHNNVLLRNVLFKTLSFKVISFKCRLCDKSTKCVKELFALLPNTLTRIYGSINCQNLISRLNELLIFQYLWLNTTHNSCLRIIPVSCEVFLFLFHCLKTIMQ